MGSRLEEARKRIANNDRWNFATEEDILFVALCDALEDEEKAEKLFGAISSFVEAKTSDLHDRINKRGQWDPDY